MGSGVYQRRRYAREYDQATVLEWLKSGKGTLKEYQRVNRPHLNNNSIFAWMQWQHDEFKNECRKYHVRNGNGQNMPEEINPEEKARNKVILNQKRWRQNLEEVVLLPKGEKNYELSKFDKKTTSNL